MNTVQFLISGKVQGVGFRAFVRDKARLLGLSGWVRNLSDGRVECVVNNDPVKLSEFENFLIQGPSWAKVDKVLPSKVSFEVKAESFDIVATKPG